MANVRDIILDELNIKSVVAVLAVGFSSELGNWR